MIRIGKDKTLDNYFIDENGVITDLKGKIQHLVLHRGRYVFKHISVHQIQMWTNYGWRDGKIWVIHHKDENKLNNSLSNLVYMTKAEHSFYHHNLPILNGENNPFYGKTHSQEVRDVISKANKGKIPWNKGKKKGIDF